MKVKVEAKAFLSALKPAIAASSGNARGLVHLSASDTGLTIRGTDGEIFVRQVVALESMDAEGEVQLAGQSLFGLVRESGAEVVTLKAATGKLNVHCGAGKHTLLCVDDTVMPKAPTTESAAGDGAYCEVQASDLAHILQCVIFAASRSQGRYAMNGTCLSIDKGMIVAVATDGRRLAVAKASCQGGFKGEVIVPARAVDATMSILGDLDGNATLRVGEGHIAIHAGDASITARLLEGRFPAYKDVIPKDTPIRATVNAAELLQAMKAVPFLSADESRAVKLCFTTAAGICADFGSPTRGEGRIELKGTTTGDLAVWLNPLFVADVLRVLDEDDAHLGMVDGDSPVVFRDGDRFLSLIMPVAAREASDA